MQERDLTGVERARSADMGQRGDHKPGKRVGSLLLEPGRERLCVKRRRVRRSPWRLGWHRRGKRFELSPHVPPRSAVARRHQVGCSRPRRILALHEALLCVEVEDGLSLVIPREGLHRKLVCHRGDGALRGTDPLAAKVDPPALDDRNSDHPAADVIARFQHDDRAPPFTIARAAISPDRPAPTTITSAERAELFEHPLNTPPAARLPRAATELANIERRLMPCSLAEESCIAPERALYRLGVPARSPRRRGLARHEPRRWYRLRAAAGGLAVGRLLCT